MEARSCSVLLLMLVQVVTGAWTNSKEDRIPTRELRRGVHYHNKRHMLPASVDSKKRLTPTPKPRELRKKPSGHLIPLEDDDMDNDEVVSVAIGPPPIRPKYDKLNWKSQSKRANNTKTSIENNNYDNNAVSFVKDVLTQLGREFLVNQVNENFVFGQYVGNAMKNLTNDLRLKMQHEILDIVIKYQRESRNETYVTTEKKLITEDIKVPHRNPNEIRFDKKLSNLSNDTEDGWPDFSNLAKIVG